MFRHGDFDIGVIGDCFEYFEKLGFFH
jgi:hypothetical protein